MRLQLGICILMVWLAAALTPAIAAKTFTTDTIYRLAETSTPLAARQEKAQSLLQAFDMAAPLFITQFRLNSDDDLAKVQHALEILLQNQNATTTTAPPPDYIDHYLVWSLARAQMVNSLDFSDANLRHFFQLNKAHYPCEPRATVSELLIPKTYTDSAGTTAILDDVHTRLQKESFPRVVYHINDQLGKHGTGYVGEVTQKQVGSQRFQLYRNAAKHGSAVGGSGDPVGGPYPTPDGWLYVQVHSIVDGPDECFDVYKNQVAQDYGREWLKKIYSDTITTAVHELSPDITPFTTGTATSENAFTVAGHSMTFAQARAAMPFLMGNERDPRFWASVQRQALEIELIYHGPAGRAIRDLPEYHALLGTLRFLTAKRAELAETLKSAPTTATLTAWFEKNRTRYTEFKNVSYDAYECETSSPALSPAAKAQCAAALGQLRSLYRSALPTSTTLSSLGVPLMKDTVTSAPFNSQRREVQVAIQDLVEGEWSPVFTENGRLRVLYLRGLERVIPQLSDIRDRVLDDYLLDYQVRFWADLVR